MNKAITNIIENSPDPLEQEVKMVLEYWENETIPVETAMKAWFKTIKQDKSHNHFVLANLTSKESRLKYARYYLDGIFSKETCYSFGNPTFSILPWQFPGEALEKG